MADKVDITPEQASKKFYELREVDMKAEEKEREHVASLVVEAWDMETLIDFAVWKVAESYIKYPDAYANDRRDFLDENQES